MVPKENENIWGDKQRVLWYFSKWPIEFSPELMNVNIDELMEKFLLLEDVDFELSTNGRMVTEMVDHQDKPDDQTKDN